MKGLNQTTLIYHDTISYADLKLQQAIITLETDYLGKLETK